MQCASTEIMFESLENWGTESQHTRSSCNECCGFCQKLVNDDRVIFVLLMMHVKTKYRGNVQTWPACTGVHNHGNASQKSVEHCVRSSSRGRLQEFYRYQRQTYRLYATAYYIPCLIRSLLWLVFDGKRFCSSWMVRYVLNIASTQSMCNTIDRLIMHWKL